MKHIEQNYVDGVGFIKPYKLSTGNLHKFQERESYIRKDVGMRRLIFDFIDEIFGVGVVNGLLKTIDEF